MRTALLPLLTAAALLLPAAAHATASTWVRTPATAEVAFCEGGQLVEQVVEGGSVMSSYATVALACMTSATQANWVLISGANCGDRVNERPGQCQTRAGRPAMDQIEAFARYAEKNGTFVRLTHARFGRRCTIVTGNEGGYGHWDCTSYKNADGTPLRVTGGRFKEVFGDTQVSVFGKSVDVPMEFPEGHQGYILNSGVTE